MKTYLRHLILIGLMTASTLLIPRASAQEAECLDASETNEVMKSFRIFKRIKNKYQLQPTIDLCNTKDFGNFLTRGILYLSKLEKDFENKQIIPQGVIGSRPLSYFKNRIKDIYLEDKVSASCLRQSQPLAYVSFSEKATMHLCPISMEDVTSDLRLSHVLIHEARHVDGYHHVKCTQGPALEVSTESLSCDENLETQGSYGVGVSYLLDVISNSFSKIDKSAARSQVVVDLLSRFNKLPLNLKPGIVVQSAAGEVSFFDGVNKSHLAHIDNSSIMFTYDYNLTFFNKNGTAQNYNYNPELEEDGYFAKLYREKLSPLEQSEFLDLMRTMRYECRLFTTRMNCKFAGNRSSEVIFKTIKPLQAIKNEFNNSFSIVGQDGTLYSLPSSPEKLLKITEKKMLKNSSSESLTSLAQLGGSTFRVTTNHKLEIYLQKDSKGPAWEPVPQFKDQAIRRILAPYVWSKDIEAL